MAGQDPERRPRLNEFIKQLESLNLPKKEYDRRLEEFINWKPRLGPSEGVDIITDSPGTKGPTTAPIDDEENLPDGF